MTSDESGSGVAEASEDFKDQSESITSIECHNLDWYMFSFCSPSSVTDLNECIGVAW